VLPGQNSHPPSIQAGNSHLIQNEYTKLFKLQESYWWFRGKEYLIRNIMDSLYPQAKDLRILDVGCGTGYITRMLGQYGDVTGLDMADIALEFCARNGVASVKKGSIGNIPFEDNQFDLVCALDILYHKAVENDEEAIREVCRVLKPGGRVIITTSAMQCLFGKNDIVQHGARRHSRNELRQKCARVGLLHERSSYYTVAFFPLVYLVRKIQDMRNIEPKSDIDEEINPMVNAICFWWFKREIDMLRYITWPFGVHLFGIFRRPSESH